MSAQVSSSEASLPSLFALAVFTVFAGNLQLAAACLPQKSWNSAMDMFEKQRKQPLAFAVIGMNKVLSQVARLSYFDYR